MADEWPEEFEEDMAFPLCNLSHASPCSLIDAQFTYADTDKTPTSTTCLTNSEYHGNPPKQCHPVTLSHTWVLFGTSLLTQWKYPQKRNANTSRRLRNGRRSHSIPWLKYKNSTENYSTPPWLYQQDECTSPTWRPCSPFSTISLSCHTPHPTICLTISTGGPSSSNPQPFPDPSQALHPLRTLTPSQMPAQALASALPSARGGALGAYF